MISSGSVAINFRDFIIESSEKLSLLRWEWTYYNWRHRKSAWHDAQAKWLCRKHTNPSLLIHGPTCRVAFSFGERWKHLQAVALILIFNIHWQTSWFLSHWLISGVYPSLSFYSAIIQAVILPISWSSSFSSWYNLHGNFWAAASFSSAARWQYSFANICPLSQYLDPAIKFFRTFELLVLHDV